MIWVLIPRGISRIVSWTVLVGLWVLPRWSMGGSSFWLGLVISGGHGSTGPVGFTEPVGFSRTVVHTGPVGLQPDHCLVLFFFVWVWFQVSIGWVSPLLSFTPVLGWNFPGRVRLGLASLLKRERTAESYNTPGFPGIFYAVSAVQSRFL